MRTFGNLLKLSAFVIYFGLGVVAFVICCQIIAKAWGLLGLCLAFLFFPIAFFAAPFYAGFGHGNWLPLILCYAPIVPAILLYVLGAGLTGED